MESGIGGPLSLSSGCTDYITIAKYVLHPRLDHVAACMITNTTHSHPAGIEYFKASQRIFIKLIQVPVMIRKSFTHSSIARKNW
jgi:hypothetical protein